MGSGCFSFGVTECSGICVTVTHPREFTETAGLYASEGELDGVGALSQLKVEMAGGSVG